MSFHNPDNSLKYARIEEERRFLLKSLPQDMLESDPFIRIIDRYIPETRLRLRRMKSPEGDTITLKLGQKYQPEDFDAQQTIMTNMYLNEAEYQVLRRLGGAQINKRRYIQGRDDTTVAWKYNIKFIKTKFSDVDVRMINKGRHELFNEAEEMRNEVFSRIGSYLEGKNG